MKLFSKKRLRIREKDGTTVIQWRKLTVVSLIVVFIIPMSSIWAIGSAMGKEEIIGLRVLPMSLMATVLLWSCIALMSLHVLFNQSSKLVINAHQLSYRKRAFPPISKTIPLNAVASITLEEKDDPIAESSGNMTPTICKLTIHSGTGKRIRIRGLSMEDMETVRDLIEGYQ